MGKLIHRKQMYHGPKAVFLDVIQDLTKRSNEECALIIKKGGAYHGKGRCKDPNRSVVQGDAIQVFYRLPIELEVLAFDPHWVIEDAKNFLVANKPAGVPTQGRRDGDSMAFYEVLKQGIPGYLGLHHRLDQGTSGLIVFSRQKAVNAVFTKMFQERRISKTYLALCKGQWPSTEQTLEVHAPIGRMPAGSRTPFGVLEDGKTAQTRFHRIGSDGDLFLVRAEPETGRTHQIRIHAAHAGFPLCGDALYGPTQPFSSHGPNLPVNQFFLHAWRLAWKNMDVLETKTFEAPIPDWWQPFLGPRLMSDWCGGQ